MLFYTHGKDEFKVFSSGRFKHGSYACYTGFIIVAHYFFVTGRLLFLRVHQDHDR